VEQAPDEDRHHGRSKPRNASRVRLSPYEGLGAWICPGSRGGVSRGASTS
jgi:hypothetical protein